MRKAIAVKRSAQDDEYKSKTELKWATTWQDALRKEFKQDAESDCFYEPFVMRVATRLRYTPDFMHILADGSIVLVEVKGSEFQRGFRQSLNKVKMVAKIFPMFHYIVAIATEGNAWNIRRVE